MHSNLSRPVIVIVHLQAPMQQGKHPPAKVTELTPAEAARESGNAAFKKGDLQKASCFCPLHGGLTQALSLVSL